MSSHLKIKNDKLITVSSLFDSILYNNSFYITYIIMNLTRDFIHNKIKIVLSF